MSWSVFAVGKAVAVKDALAKQFANAKNGAAHVPHEAASVALIEQVVNGQLDFLAEATHTTVVEVKAGGSAWGTEDSSGKKGRSTATNMEVKVIPGFVE